MIDNFDDWRAVDVIRGLDFDKYLAIDAASNSRLKLLDHSPSRYKANPSSTVTRSMSIGTLAHCAVLEPSEFDLRYVAPPPSCSDRRTKAYREWADLAPRGAEIVRAQDAAMALEIAATIAADEHLKRFFGPDCESELTIVWIDDASGVRCKCRLDKFCPGIGFIDLKTTQDCSPAQFPWAAKKYSYFQQAAFYRRGIQAAQTAGLLPSTGDDARCYMLAIESGAIREHALYVVPDAEITFFDAQIAEKLETLKQCAKSGQWPGPGGMHGAPIPLEYRGRLGDVVEDVSELGEGWGDE